MGYNQKLLCLNLRPKSNNTNFVFGCFIVEESDISKIVSESNRLFDRMHGISTDNGITWEAKLFSKVLYREKIAHDIVPITYEYKQDWILIEIPQGTPTNYKSKEEIFFDSGFSEYDLV
jgi:hypothetical protein